MSAPATPRVCLRRLPGNACDPGPAWLNAAERERLSHMTAPRRRLQFLAGHELARVLAAEASGTPFAEWDLVADEHGAPRLLLGGAPCGWHVSLAHGGDWVAAAVAPVRIGIDIESAPRERDLAALARHAFAPRNAEDVVALAGDERRAAFYRYWALAEARGKHGGRGFQAHVARAQAFVERDPGAGQGATWQEGDTTLAAWIDEGPGDIGIEGWAAPVPRHWGIDP
jgi:4'-phosphopantetheinyl transferase